MLNWSLNFFILAVIAAVLGFGGIAGTFAWAAKFLFFAFVVLFVLSIISKLLTGKGPTPPA